MVIKETTK